MPALADSLLAAIVRADGDAIVMHVGERPYVVVGTNPLHISTHELTLETSLSMLSQLLAPEALQTLEEDGAVEYRLPDLGADRFNCVAARGGDDIWIEIRRRRNKSDEAVAAAEETARAAAEAEARRVAEEAEAERLAEEAEARRLAEEAEARRLVEEAEARRAAEEVEARLAAEAEVRRVAEEAEARRIAEEAEARRLAEEAEARRLAEEAEARRLAAEVEARRVAEEEAEARRLAEEAEARRIAEEAEARRIAEEAEARRVAEEAEARRIAEEVAARRAAEEAEARRLAADARRVAEEAEARRVAAELEARRVAQQAEARRLAEEAEMRRVAAEAEARRLAAEAEARRVAAEAEARRVAEEAEARRAALEAEARRLAEAETRRAAEEAEARRLAEVAEARRIAEEAEVRRVAQEAEARRRAQEAEARRAAEEAEARRAAEEAALRRAAEEAEAARMAAEEVARRAAEEEARRAAELEAQVAAAAIEVVDEAPAVAEETIELASQPVEVGETIEIAEPLPVVVPMTRTVRIEVPSRGGSSRTTDIERLLRIAAARGASALFFTSESRPYIRVDGDIRQLEGEPILSRSDVEAAIVEIAPGEVGKGTAAEWLREYPELGRIRCTTFNDHRGPGLLLRMIATRAATAEQLGLSREVQALATESQGLVLVAGPRASGKSTLMSALVDLVNRQRAEFVITLERQIRLVHDNRSALVSQREIRGGADEALAAARSALREGPDVLVIDDLISPQMVPLILTAASEGLLVFVSMATPSTTDAVQRFIEMASPEMRGAVQGAMAESFRGAVAQVLLKKIGGGLIAAREVMLATAPVARVIAEGQLAQLPHVLESGRKYGMAPFTEMMIEYVRAGSVDVREAFRKTPDRERLLAGLKREKIDTSLIERLA